MSNGRPWTADDTATLRRMARAGYSDAEIGTHIGRDRQWVGRRRREMGITSGFNPALGAMVARWNIRRKWTAGMVAARCI